MVYIEGGYFMMGSPEDEPRRIGNEVLHQVKVSGFYLGKYEVSRAEYAAVTGVDIYGERYRLTELYRRDIDAEFKEDLRYPDEAVRHVSWYEAVEYCNKRSGKEGLRPAYRIEKRNETEWLVEWDRGAEGYRLPTEAEWEYACRAGTMGPFNTGDDIMLEQANYATSFLYNSDSYRDPVKRNAAFPSYPTFEEIMDGRARNWSKMNVGGYAPNQWGLYDMHGNVWEWCWDWYGEYPQWPQTDPVGPDVGVYRVLRGGSYDDPPQALRSAFRNYIRPSGWDGYTGFRVARSVPGGK
jgi:formylglycine-generating enzyme required for sulfatase activity